MNNRISLTLLAAGLAVALLLTYATTVTASNHDTPNVLYYPWVPSDAMLDASGPYNGIVTIQNLEEERINLFVVPLSYAGEEPPLIAPRTLERFSKVSLSPSQIAISDDLDGSGVLVYGERLSDQEPARISGVQIQAQPVAPRADGSTGAEHVTVGGYSALTEDDVGTDVVLPIAQSNSGWNTIIRVTNFADSGEPAPVTISFFAAESGQGAGSTTEMIEPGQTATINLKESQIGAGWVGSARITAGVPVGAVAERVKPERTC